ncbi:MAG: sulfatase family protein [Actinomycetota bacterium]
MRPRSTVVLVLLATAFAASAIPQRSATAARRPNVVVIMTDDQRSDTLEHMPTVRTSLQRRGVTFRNAFVPNALCCPSRVSTLTGLHSHTTGVYGNKLPWGGFSAFDDDVTIATVLEDAGYRTLYVGKYLNGYPREGTADHRYVPPGWDRWFAIPGGAYYDYVAADNGRKTSRFGRRPEDYSGRVLTRRAIADVRSTRRGHPFFLFYAPSAPHAAGSDSGADPVKTATPDPRDVGRFADEPPWRPATYGTRDDVSDMPEYVRRKRWRPALRDRIDLFRQRQLESLYSLDREVGRILGVLPRNTLVIFLSDNGFLWGEHRWRAKLVPYEESIRIPMIVRWPGVVHRRVDRRLVLNIDVVPTILAAAGLPRTTPTGIDPSTGKAVRAQGLDLLGRKERARFVLEHFNGADGGVPGYCGVRTADGWMYARYWQERSPDNGFEDLYRVSRDPLQRRNLATRARFAPKKDDLRALTRRLCDPPPPTYRWSG